MELFRSRVVAVGVANKLGKNVFEAKDVKDDPQLEKAYKRKAAQEKKSEEEIKNKYLFVVK